MAVLYHYTDRAGKDGIYADKLIRATDAHDKLGNVVRFTELPHDTYKAKLIENNWGYNPPSNAADKLRFWFKFNIADLPPTTYKIDKLKGRNIWVTHEDVPIQPTSQLTTAQAQGTPKGRTFYHYTDKKGLDIINDNGYITPKTDWSQFGLKSVVKLTDLVPTSSKHEIVSHLFGMSYVTPDLEAKTKYWFKFDESDLRELKRIDKHKQRRLWTTPLPVYTNKVVKQNTFRRAQHSTGRPSNSQEGYPPRSSSQHSTGRPSNGQEGYSPRSSPQHSTGRPSSSQEERNSVMTTKNSWVQPVLQTVGQSYLPAQATVAVQPFIALYYYTNREGKDDIFRTGLIASQGGRVSLTDRKPSPLTGAASTLLGGAASSDYWFEFRDIDLGVVKPITNDQGMTLWVVDGDVELARSTSQGRLST